MRVLFVARDDYEQVFGGDNILRRKIQKYLQPHGVQFEFATAQRLPASPHVDVVHLTCFLVEPTQRVLEWAQRFRIPTVISPLFEEPLHTWFEWAMRCPGKWRSVGRVLGRRLARRIYITWQAARIKRGAQWHRQRELLQAMHITPNSRYELNHLQKWFNLPDLDATVVPLGIDPEVFGQSPFEREIPGLGNLTGYVLEVGRIETRKNQLGLLQALRNVPISIVLLGRFSHHEHEVSYVRECEEMAACRGNVLFIKQLPEKALPALYARAAVHVLPSWSERPGLVTLEAAACSCKAVSTGFSSIREYLGDDVWYCRPDDVKSIRTAVEQALAAPTPPGLQARVLNNFTWGQTAWRMWDVYQRMVS